MSIQINRIVFVNPINSRFISIPIRILNEAIDLRHEIHHGTHQFIPHDKEKIPKGFSKKLYTRKKYAKPTQLFSSTNLRLRHI